MATERVLDNRGMEIHIYQPNKSLPTGTRIINTAHKLRLTHDTPIVRRRLQHFIIMGHKLVSHLQGYFIHKR